MEVGLLGKLYAASNFSVNKAISATSGRGIENLRGSRLPVRLRGKAHSGLRKPRECGSMFDPDCTIGLRPPRCRGLGRPATDAAAARRLYIRSRTPREFQPACRFEPSPATISAFQAAPMKMTSTESS